jgi:hypothetical protein
MHSVAVALALITLVFNAIAALIGAWSWYRFESPQAFWLTLRAGQGAAVAQALFAGIAFVSGARPDDGLYWLYAVLPVAVGFLAEQLRLTVAHAELDRRGLPDAQAAGALPETEQQLLVRSILHRELGIMAISAAVVCFLALRALGTSAGL